MERVFNRDSMLSVLQFNADLQPGESREWFVSGEPLFDVCRKSPITRADPMEQVQASLLVPAAGESLASVVLAAGNLPADRPAGCRRSLCGRLGMTCVAVILSDSEGSQTTLIVF